MMRNKIKTILLSALAVFCTATMKSQTGKDNYFPPAPEAASLIKYVDVPVNYSTGVINYSIPIHNIKLKNLNIPITMSYQSSGYKPSEIAANTGLGWELNAGGKIVQNISGQSDIEGFGPNNNFGNIPIDRDLKLPFPANNLNWTQSPYSLNQLDSIRGSGTDYTKLYDIDQYNIDTKPDLFYYSMPNKSGKFFFGDNFEAKQIPFGKEKIIYNGGGGGFEIIDTGGVRYIYNVSATTYNVTENVSLKFPKLSGNSNSLSYTYYLAKIITPDNETVDFIYDTVKYNLIKDKDYTRYYHWFFGGGEKVTSYYSEITAKVLTKIKVNQDYEIDFLYTKYRKDILGTTQATAPKTLDNIKIKYKNEIENYSFDYGYFGTAEGTYNSSFESLTVNENSSFILKLKSIQKTGENPYAFSYFNEGGAGRYSECLDHWGFYNESCKRYTLNTLFGDLGATKQPSLDKTLTNVLKNITLPTKGEVEFTYELNSCSNCNISYPVYDWKSFYLYSNDDDNFSGEFVSRELVFTVPENAITAPYIKFNLTSPGEATTTNYAIAELYDDQGKSMDMRTIGSPGDNFRPYLGEGLEKGKTYKLVLRSYDTMENENKYIGIHFLFSEEVTEPIPAVGGLRIKNIKTSDLDEVLTNRSFDYLENGESSGVLYEVPSYADEYAYFSEIVDPDANTIVNGLISYTVQHSRIPSDLFGFSGSHIFYKKVTEKLIDVNNPADQIKTEKYFTFFDDIRYGEQSYFSKISYDWKRGLPLQINEFRYNDIVKKTIFSYKFLDTPAGNNTSKYEPGFPINNPSFPNEYYKRSIDLSVYRRNLSFYNLYLYSNSRLTSAWYYMDKKTTEENLDGKILKTEEEYKYENSGHAQLTSQITTNSNGQKIEAKYYYPDDLLGEPFMQDLKSANRISIPVVTEQYKEGVLIFKSKTAYAKDGTTGNLLLPKDLYQAKFPNNFTDIPNIGALEKKVTYDKYDEKGNVLQYTPEKSTPVSIVWGYNKTYPIAKIENTLYSSIPLETIANLQNLSNADFDNCLGADCKEQLLRNAFNTFRNSLENVFVTTYTYNPLVGVTSITDPKGISTYYEYDAANRLKFIKDKDLNVLQKYCYNYKGQQTDCGDNTSTTVIPYKSIARSGTFTRNNCVPGGTGSVVSYSQPQGAYISDISQDDADAQGLALFNTNGQANANSNGTCTFSSIARSGTFTKNNCAPGGSGSNVDYSQAAGAVTSTVSQADADAQGLAVFNANGQNNANVNGYCTFYSAARSGSFTKNDCAAGGSGSVVGYSLNAGAFSSTISQADADNQALNYFNGQGQANANANGYCTFYSTARSGSFTKNDCAAGGTGSVVSYSLQAGAFSSTVSQADADNQALNYFNAQGQHNANVNGICTFSSTARNGSFAKNNCAPGGSGSNVNYSQAAGAVTSAVSQADADAQGLAVFNANGQNNANANGYCTFYSAARSGSFTKNDCAAGGTGSVVGYNLQSGAFSSTISQADADNQALNYFNAQGQANANANGYCTFYSAARSGSFTKNDCPSGGNPSSTAYSLNAGAFTSTVSQADADNQALNYFNAQGQANANASGYCIYYNSYKSGSFIKNNCVSGGVGSTVLYEVWGGTYSSTSSQAAADALAQNAVNANGQAYANANGYCTFYSQQIMEKIYKNDYCPPGTTYPYVYYYVPYAKYYSTISQNDADGKAWAEVAANGQAYANATGTCLNPGELED